jgi:uncharacterized lipoprotein YajG
MLKVFFLLLLIFISLFTACKRSSLEQEMIPPATPPLSRQIVGYGVISINYTHVFDKRGNDGTALGILRKGTVVEVLERYPFVSGGIAEKWVLASNGTYVGWLNENRLRIYDSRPQAETAAGTLLQ